MLQISTRRSIIFTLVIATSLCFEKMDAHALPISGASIRSVENGRVIGESMPAGNVWKENGAVVFVVRRPG